MKDKYSKIKDWFSVNRDVYKRQDMNHLKVQDICGVMILMCILFQEIAMKSYYCIWLKV